MQNRSKDHPKKHNDLPSPDLTSVNTMTTQSKVTKNSKRHGNIQNDTSMCSSEDTGNGADLDLMVDETEDFNNNNDKQYTEKS